MQIFNVKNDKYLLKCADILFHTNKKIDDYKNENNKYKKELEIKINKLNIYLNNCIDNKTKFNYKKHDLLFNDNNEISIINKNDINEIDSCYLIENEITFIFLDDINDIYDENIPYNIPKRKTYTLTNKQYNKIEELCDLIEDLNTNILIGEQQTNKLINYQNTIIKNIKKDLKIKLYTGNNAEKYSPDIHDIIIIKNNDKWEFAYINKLNTKNFINNNKECKKINTIEI